LLFHRRKLGAEKLDSNTQLMYQLFPPDLQRAQSETSQPPSAWVSRLGG
jgi:hypothetical protein